jgi:hypothetical protein
VQSTSSLHWDRSFTPRSLSVPLRHYPLFNPTPCFLSGSALVHTMSLQVLLTLDLVQGCFQISFWYSWLVRFAQGPDSAPGTLAIGSVVLLGFSMVPVSLLTIALVRTLQSQPYARWLGLGCTAATFLSNTAMVLVSDLRNFMSGINQALDIRNHMVWLPDFQTQTSQTPSPLFFDLPLCCWLGCVSCGDGYGGV